jgi:hypothetical protein
VEHRILLLVALLTPLSWSVACAADQDCRNLDARNRSGKGVSIATGQRAMTIIGPLKKVKPPENHIRFPDGPIDTMSISLERSVCYGSCPSYSIEMKGDGSASYFGRSNVLINGKHSFDVPTSKFKCLVTQFRKADFWSLADKYVADVTDSPKYVISFSVGGRAKTIIDYVGSAVGMPPAVSVLEEEIDRIGADSWVHGDSETLAHLRSEGFDFQSEAAATLLANAATRGVEELAISLIELGAPVTGHASEPQTMDAFSTTVVRASGAGLDTVVQAAIAKGALSAGPPDIADAALLRGAASGNPLVVAEILKHNPNVNAQDGQGNTALINLNKQYYYANDKSKIDVASCAKLLLAAGADQNIVDGDGNTALFGASSAEIVKILVESGVKVNHRNKYGATPLLYAATDDAAVALIEAGADMTAKDNFGNTINRIAIAKKFPKTIGLLNGQKH